MQALAYQNKAFDILAVSVIIAYCLLQSRFAIFFFAVLVFTAIYLLYIVTQGTPVSVSSKFPYMPSQNEKQPSRLVIYANDVMRIHTCSDSTAARKIKEVKDHLEKRDHQVITIAEYCDYWGLDYLQTCYFLNVM